MILQHDAPFLGTKRRSFLEFAGKMPLFPILGSNRNGSHLSPIQPMFDLVAFRHDAGLVEFARRMEFFVERRSLDRIDGCGGAQVIRGVFPLCVIQDLVLETKYCTRIIGHPVFYTAVASGDDFPLEGKLEVLEASFRVKVACFRLADDATIFHDPPRARRSSPLVRPLLESFPVEERDRLSLRQRRAREYQQ